MMRLPWWPTESDEVTPAIHSVQRELDELLVELQRYGDRLNEAAEQPPPHDQLQRRRGLTGE